MSEAAEIETRLRAAFPGGIPVRVDKQDELLTGAAYEARLAQMVAEVVTQEAASAAADAEGARVAQLLAAIEGGTSAEAIAALRELAPRLVWRR